MLRNIQRGETGAKPEKQRRCFTFPYNVVICNIWIGFGVLLVLVSLSFSLYALKKKKRGKKGRKEVVALPVQSPDL